MKRFFFRWLAPLLLAGTCCLPALHAQPLPSTPDNGPVSTDPAERVPAFQYFFSMLAVTIVMLIICTPSRKQVATKG